jgi:hypothetical protein
MLDPEQPAREVLARARRGLSPTASDAARVLAGLDAALLGGPEAGSQPPSNGSPLGEPAVEAARHVSGGVLAWAAKLAAIGVIAGAAGTAGYALGLRAGRAEGRPNSPATEVAASAVTAAAPKVDPGEKLATVATAPPLPDSVKLARSAAPPAPSASAFPLSPEQSLAEETRALARVERALRNGNPGLALLLLDELGRAVPHGRLMEEREAAWAITRCQLGRGAPNTLVEDFARRYPNSVYLKRVEKTCGEANQE